LLPLSHAENHRGRGECVSGSAATPVDGG